MFKCTVGLFLALILVEECCSTGDITIKNVQLVSKKLGQSCVHSAVGVTCKVRGGESVDLTATWVVDGGAASLGLELLRVALKFSDGVGDHNNIIVCQKTGGNFEFVENPCSIFMVASASYDMDPYRFMIPHSGSKKREQMSIWLYMKWSDGSSSSKKVGVLNLIFQK